MKILKVKFKIYPVKLNFYFTGIIFLSMMFFGIFGLAKNSFAIPAIDSVSGNFSNGESIIISGSGFGTKSQATPLISSYDNSVDSDNWETGAISSNWLTWNNPSLTSSNPRTNTYQSSNKIIYDASGEYSAIGLSHSVPEDKIYISYWMYRDYSSWGGNANGNQKWTRIYESTSHDDESASIMTSTVWDGSGGFSHGYFAAEHAPSCSGWIIDYTSPLYNATKYSSVMYYTNLQNGHPNLQEWEHWEYYIDYPSAIAATDASTVLWKNGATVQRAINIAIDEVGNPNTARDILIGQVSGGQTVSSNEYLDQIYIDNTSAHVFISDQPTYSWPDNPTLSHNEIQVASTWTDDLINITFNQGSFDSEETAYLYIVDENEDVSDGYPITLGESSDTTPPSAPSGLSVS